MPDQLLSALTMFLQDYGVYVSFGAVLIIGFFAVLSDYRKLAGSQRLARDFHSHFAQYCTSEGQDAKAYPWTWVGEY